MDPFEKLNVFYTGKIKTYWDASFFSKKIETSKLIVITKNITVQLTHDYNDFLRNMENLLLII